MRACITNNSQLLAGVDESDLLDLDTLLLLQGLLDGEDLVLGLKVEGLLAAGEGLDENLRDKGGCADTEAPCDAGGGCGRNERVIMCDGLSGGKL